MNTPAADTVVYDSGRVDAENPWPGLISYSEADQKYFYGRDREIQALLTRVKRKRVSVLYASSGMGKSSLLAAGLFPLLREEHFLPISIRMDFSKNSASFADQMLAEIVRQAKQAGAEPPALNGGDSLWEYFHRPDADFWSERNRLLTPVLVFDQFEEFFTLGRRDAQRESAGHEFLEQLTGLAEGRPPAQLRARLDANPALAGDYVFGSHNYKILLSLREDYLPELEALQDRMSDLALNRLRILRMNGDAALTVVNQAPHLIDPPVAIELVRVVAAAADPETPLAKLEVEPALLSVVCRELNNRRQQHRDEKITGRLLQGSESEILAQFYERSISGLPAEVRTFIEEQLLTVSGFRDSIALENALATPGLSRESLSELENRRLIRVDTRAGHERVELTHDLITDVIRDSRDERRRTESAREAAKREREVSNKLRRSRRIAAVFLLLSVSSIALAGWGWIERRKAQANALQAEAHAEKARTSEIKMLEATKLLKESKNEEIEQLESDIAGLEPASRGIDRIPGDPSISPGTPDTTRVRDAQRKFYASFDVKLQFRSTASREANTGLVVPSLEELGFVADPSNITVIPSISGNAVIYHDEYAGDEARLIAKKMPASLGEFDIQLVRVSDAPRQIVVRIATE